jgi:hypothetical protein
MQDQRGEDRVGFAVERGGQPGDRGVRRQRLLAEGACCAQGGERRVEVRRVDEVPATRQVRHRRVVDAAALALPSTAARRRRARRRVVCGSARRRADGTPAHRGRAVDVDVFVLDLACREMADVAVLRSLPASKAIHADVIDVRNLEVE